MLDQACTIGVRSRPETTEGHRGGRYDQVGTIAPSAVRLWNNLGIGLLIPRTHFPSAFSRHASFREQPGAKAQLLGKDRDQVARASPPFEIGARECRVERR